jgi:hypothetical protein
MKKTVDLIAVLILLLPALGFYGALSFRLGYFVPRAQSDLWTIEFENMTFQKSDYQTTTLGIHYEHFLTKQVSLLIGVDSYSQTRLGDYMDFVGYSFDEGDFAFPAEFYEGDFAISHNFGVSITPVQLALKLAPWAGVPALSPMSEAGFRSMFGAPSSWVTSSISATSGSMKIPTSAMSRFTALSIASPGPRAASRSASTVSPGS